MVQHSAFGVSPFRLEGKGPTCRHSSVWDSVWRWVEDIAPFLNDDDPLGVEDLKTHEMPLQDAPLGYEIFQKKQDGAIKCVLKP
jgi:threonine dehydrogenase-like Zn-dependent dehydrogenase